MSDYRFTVKLHTDRANFNTNYSLNDYKTTLPSFYFTRNEFVSAKAQVNAINSILSCTGANIFNAEAAIRGISKEYTTATISIYNNVSAITGLMGSNALVSANSVKFSPIVDSAWLLCYTVPNVI